MTPRPATVYLVGAGPGDPDLITVRGLNLLRRADTILYDRLAPPELLDAAPPGAERINVGKAPNRHPVTQDRINDIIIDHARRGRTVVRLKGGDPFIFGRGAEELRACVAAGVPCVVVPGVSSALAAPAAAGIPLTHRHLARSFAVVTARTDADTPNNAPDLDYRTLAAVDTLVIMMGRADLRRLTQRLIDAGRAPDTPAACIQSATTPKQRITRADLVTLADAVDRDGLTAPVVTVIGPTAAFTTAAAPSPLTKGGPRGVRTQ